MTAADSRTDHAVLAEDHLTEAAEHAKANDYTRAIMASSMATVEAILALPEAVARLAAIPETGEALSDREVVDGLAEVLHDRHSVMGRERYGMPYWRIMAREVLDHLQSIGVVA